VKDIHVHVSKLPPSYSCSLHEKGLREWHLARKALPFIITVLHDLTSCESVRPSLAICSTCLGLLSVIGFPRRRILLGAHPLQTRAHASNASWLFCSSSITFHHTSIGVSRRGILGRSKVSSSEVSSSEFRSDSFERLVVMSPISYIHLEAFANDPSNYAHIYYPGSLCVSRIAAFSLLSLLRDCLLSRHAV